MTRNDVIGMLLREMAEEMPIVLRALPDDRLWCVMVAGLMADNDVDEMAEKIADMPVSTTGPANWREFYGTLREMVNDRALADTI